MSGKFLNNFCLLSLMLLVTLVCGCSRESGPNIQAGAYEVIDDQGTRVMLAHKPTRILTLAMGLDSIVLGMLPEDRLIAVNALADDPASSNIVTKAQKIQRKIKNPSAEEVLALKPDLVFVYNWGKAEIVDNLRELGIKTIVVKGPKSINDVKDNIKTIAGGIGEAAKGTQLIAMMDTKLSEIKTKIDNIKPEERKKIVLISLMTSYGGKGCTFDDICQYAGVIF